VWETCRARPAAKFLLLAIADRADDDGTNAFPSYAWLANRTGLSPRHIKRLVPELEGDGYLDVERVSGRSHRYRVVLTQAVAAPVTRVVATPVPAMGGAVLTRLPGPLVDETGVTAAHDSEDSIRDSLPAAASTNRRDLARAIREARTEAHRARYLRTFYKTFGRLYPGAGA